jgi:cell division protein FtsL
MTWIQVVTIVLPILVAIIVGIIYNNRRIDDLRQDFHRLEDRVSSRVDRLENRLERIEGLLIELLKELRKEKSPA